MKILNSSFLSLSFIAASLSFADISLAQDLERGGGVIGDGGSVVQLPTGATVPADFFYKRQNVPGDYRRVRTSDFPGLQEQYDALLQYICRFDCPEFKSLAYNFELYLTNQLSGHDPLPVEEGHAAIPATFTYVLAPAPGESLRDQRRIIEIRPELFARLTPRDQALQLFHEVMHHDTPYGHNVISPLIKGLGTAFNIIERQTNGNREVISSAETATLNLMWTAIRTWSPGIQDESRWFSVTPHGGWVHCQWTKNQDRCNEFIATNFVGADSVVSLSYVDSLRNAAYGSIRGNEFLGVSQMMLFLYPEKSCSNNRFHQVASNRVQCQGSNNQIQSLTGSLNLYGDNNVLNQVITEFNEYILDYGVNLGQGNRISNSRLQNVQWGDHGEIENSTVNGLTLRESSSTRLVVRNTSILANGQNPVQIKTGLPELTIENLNLVSIDQRVVIQPKSKSLIFTPRGAKEFYVLDRSKIGLWDSFLSSDTTLIRDVKSFESENAIYLRAWKGN